MALLRSLPENATLADLRQTYADLLEKLRPYGHRLMRGPSPLTPGERELIAAFVSGVNSCRYCRGAHSLVAQAFGVDEAVLAASLDDIAVAPVAARLKPILRYVRKLTETPSRMTAADAAAVYDAGWSDEALLHAIAVCAYFNNMNRLVEGTGIVGTTEEYAVAAQRLVAHGYLRGAGRWGRSRTRPKSVSARRRGEDLLRRGILGQRGKERHFASPQLAAAAAQCGCIIGRCPAVVIVCSCCAVDNLARVDPVPSPAIESPNTGTFRYGKNAERCESNRGTSSRT